MMFIFQDKWRNLLKAYDTQLISKKNKVLFFDFYRLMQL
jgi:hypothetical protein